MNSDCCVSSVSGHCGCGCCQLHSCPSLIMFLLENSDQMIETNLFQNAIPKLRVCMLFFCIEVVTDDLSTVWPARRMRSWVRGIRRDATVGQHIPSPLPDVVFRSIKLEHLLDLSLPNTNPWVQSTVNKTIILQAHMQQIRLDIANNTAGEIAFIDLGRTTQ